ncbi:MULTISPECIES: ABC transporter permease [unclassified Crossiella]|uniref:ABC transporter permease n=1 Tax=unclassified Crossiella TaxID=2620835 RepID=UPI001FFFB2FE|nr:MULTISPECIES: ABC transporter permease [unclassified Crossiella]MCK2244762.1 ABC transporter permease [Crossiella sp. S99.2]MCK2258404.1 ABC transporter permease [Crossiella sp. S99.1]
MTTTLPEVRAAQRIRLSAAGVLRGEWIKLISVRSSAVCLLNAVVAMFSAVLLLSIRSTMQMAKVERDPVATVLSGAEFAGLGIGVLGVLLVSTEYATGLVRVVFTAVPARLPVLFAKIAAVLLAVFPVMLVASAAAFLAGMGVLAANGGSTTALTDPGALRGVVGTAAALAGIGVLGVALGTILRGTAAGVTAVIAVVFLLPNVGDLLPLSWQQTVLKFLPAKAIEAFTHSVQDPALLTPATGALVFTGWVTAAVTLAALRLRHRDA